MPTTEATTDVRSNLPVPSTDYHRQSPQTKKDKKKKSLKYMDPKSKNLLDNINKLKRNPKN